MFKLFIDFQNLFLIQYQCRLAINDGFVTHQWHPDSVFIDNPIAASHMILALRYRYSAGFLVGIEDDNNVLPAVYAFQVLESEGKQATILLHLSAIFLLLCNRGCWQELQMFSHSLSLVYLKS